MSRQMQDRLAPVVGLIDIVVVGRLEEVDEGLYSVVINTHEQHILVFGGAVVHVGAALGQELDHLEVAVEGCVVDGQVALFVGGVDPGPQFADEGRLAGVHT